MRAVSEGGDRAIRHAASQASARVRTRLLGLLIVPLVCLLLAACGGSSSPPPPSLATLLGAGTALVKAGNYGAAGQLFQQAVKRFPTNAAAHYDLGVVYQNEGQTQLALRQYLLAISREKTYVPALYNLGILYSSSQRPLAIFYFRRAIEAQPDSPTAWLRLGLLLAENKHPTAQKNALKAFAKAVQLDPSLASQIPPALRAKLPKSHA